MRNCTQGLCCKSQSYDFTNKDLWVKCGVEKLLAQRDRGATNWHYSLDSISKRVFPFHCSKPKRTIKLIVLPHYFPFVSLSFSIVPSILWLLPVKRLLALTQGWFYFINAISGFIVWSNISLQDCTIRKAENHYSGPTLCGKNRGW